MKKDKDNKCEIWIDWRLYEDLSEWAKACGTTPARLAEACIMAGLAFNNLIAAVQEGEDPKRWRKQGG